MAQPPPTTGSPPLIRVLCASHAAASRRWTGLARQLADLGVRSDVVPGLPPEMRAELIERAAVATLDDDRSVLVLAPTSDQRRGPLFSERTHSSLVEFVTILKLRGRVAFIREREGDEAQLPEALRGVPVFEISDGDSVLKLVEWARVAVGELSGPSEKLDREYEANQRMAEINDLERRGDLQGAIRAANVLYQSAREARNNEAAASLGIRLANLKLATGDADGASTHAQEALDVSSGVNNLPLLARAQRTYGEVYAGLKQYRSALELYTRALDTSSRADDAAGQCAALLGMGQAHEQMGQRSAALNHYQDALKLAESLRDSALIDSVRARIASISAYETPRESTKQARPVPTGQTTQPPSPDSLSIGALSSFSLSPGAQAVLDRAKAMTPPGGRWATLTTLAFLFAFKELGRETPQTQDTIHFVHRYFDRQAGARYQTLYETTVRTWMEDSPPGLGTDQPPGAWVSTITPNVLRLFNRAKKIAGRTWLHDGPSTGEDLGEPTRMPSVIHARHLFAALLTFEPELGSRNSIVEKLNYLGIDLASLKGALFEIVAANAPEDNVGAWRQMLGLSPASDQAPSTPIVDASKTPGPDGGAGLAQQKREEPAELGQAQRPPETPPARKGDEAPASPRPATFLSPFHGDDNETDRLNLKHEIDALAYLIASQSVHPPLAIGLFGEWGSGKSFFMTQLRKRISAIADAARKADAEARAAAEARRAPKIAPEDIGWHRHICQIEFNAWHYVEGNIWASLVEHIFSNLRSSLVSPKASLEAQRLQEEEFRREFETSKHALAELESRIASARKDLSNAEAAVAGARENHRLKAGLLGELKSGPTALSVLRSLLGQPAFEARLRELGLTDEVLASPARVREAIQALSAEADAWRTPLSLLSGRAIESRLLKWGLLALLVVAAPAAAFIASKLFTEFDREIKLLVGLAVQLAAVCTAVVGWIGAQAGRLAKARAKLDPVLHQLDERRSEELVRTERDLAVAKTNLDQALTDYAQQQKKVEELQAQEKAATATELMAQFIEQRAACTDYRRHLGITAIVRRDFAKLTELVARRSAEARLRPVGELDRQPIDRIVLYIDDLDRCPPDKVVAVLEAIHLILAFKLFVVVVGVDARWISRSLRKKYGPLLAGRSTAARAAEPPRGSKTPAAVPEDYLEKIFQIPFRLRPLTSTGTEDLLDHLLQPPPGAKAAPAGQSARAATTNIAVQVQTQAPAPAGPAQGSGGPQLVAAPAGPQDPALLSGQPVAPTNVAPTNVVLPNIEPVAPTSTTPQPVQEPRAEVKAKTLVEPDVDLTPGRLELTTDEIKFMKHLAPVIGRSPRAVHRFVNCYRLLKAARDPGKLTAFESSAGPGAVPPYEAAMLMLAIIIGVPEVAGPALSMLVARVPQAELSNLIADWDRDERILAEPDWKQRIEPFLRAYARAKGKPCPVAPFREAASVVARYSFRTGMMEELEIAAGPQEPGLKPGSAPSEKA